MREITKKKAGGLTAEGEGKGDGNGKRKTKHDLKGSQGPSASRKVSDTSQKSGRRENGLTKEQGERRLLPFPLIKRITIPGRRSSDPGKRRLTKGEGLQRRDSKS